MIRVPFTTRKVISHIVWMRTNDSKKAAKRLKRFGKLPLGKKIEKGMQWTGWLKRVDRDGKVAHLYFLCVLKSEKGWWEVCGWSESAEGGKKESKEYAKEVLLKEVRKILKAGVWKHGVGGKGELVDPYWFAVTKRIGWKYHPVNSWLPLLILSYLPIKIYRELKFKEWLPLKDPDLIKL